MRQYLVVRIAQLIPALILASIAIWALIYLLPGDPAIAILGPNATPQQLQDLRQSLGLDQPAYMQYANWLGRVLRGDFGISYQTGLPVLELIGTRAIATVQLGTMAFLVSMVLGVTLGVIAAARPNSGAARFVSTYNSLTLALPSFWLGLLLILLFGVWLKILPPASGFVPIWLDPLAALRYSVLPIITLASYTSGIVARFVRSAMVDVLGADYVRTARAKGVQEQQVVWRHALRNALLPTVTVLGLQFGAFIGGAVVTEGVFNYPGLGTLVLSSVTTRDYTVLQGAILMIVASFTLVNLAVDVLYALLDPRIQYG
ncbi:MAG: ABC transporter permease [Chloroflexi bacterium]|nr:ABC transporter permease [Chloroflexota bacterium]MBV9544589.1 ABC transporter permease [Chloroflexota bacterium]